MIVSDLNQDMFTRDGPIRVVVALSDVVENATAGGRFTLAPLIGPPQHCSVLHRCLTKLAPPRGREVTCQLNRRDS
jgi:hypothetical protein